MVCRSESDNALTITIAGSNYKGAREEEAISLNSKAIKLVSKSILMSLIILGLIETCIRTCDYKVLYMVPQDLGHPSSQRIRIRTSTMGY